MNRSNIRRKIVSGLAIIALGVLSYLGGVSLFSEQAQPTVYAQQDQYLSRRIDQVEQRFYSIESRINRLEQEQRTTVRPSGPPLFTNKDAEIEYLRSQVEGLRFRIGELECGLLRVDERTLSKNAKLAESKTGTTTSGKCRELVDEPIRLSARP